MTRPPSADNPSRDPRLRLALVSTELGVGGAERCVTQLALGLQQRGHEVVVYSLAPSPEAPRDGFVRSLEAAAVPVQFLGVRRKRHAAAALRQLTELLRQQQPHVVQTFLFHANILGTNAARRAGLTRIVAGLRVVDRRWLRVSLERWSSRWWQRAVSVSQSVDAFAETALRLPAARRLVIPNGIDLSRFTSSENGTTGTTPVDWPAWGIPAPAPTLVAIGRLHPQKGFDWLIEQMPSIVHDLPNHHLLIVGEGPARASLDAQIKRLGLAARVHLAGWQANVPAILQSAAGLLLPSRWEGLPNVVLEAMAAGRPVLAAQVEGVTELLGELSAPQTFPWGNASEFRTKLLAWAESSAAATALATSLGSANHQRAIQTFSLRAMIDRYERLYQELVLEA
ncbi:MAG: glycosyltransferase [Planctomycetota bacterium]